MTKDKAIEILKHCGAENYCFDYKYRNCANCNQRIAQNMAIEALKTEAIPIDWIKKRMEDLNEYISKWGGMLEQEAVVNAKIHEGGGLVRLIADWLEERKEE